MSTEEIQMKCNELCGKSAAELTTGLSQFYGGCGMWKSIRRIIRDIYREGEMKAKNAYCDGLNKGRIEGVSGTVLVCLALGTVGIVVTKVKHSKERKKVWDANRRIREDSIYICADKMRRMQEAHKRAKERAICQENHRAM